MSGSGGINPAAFNAPNIAIARALPVATTPQPPPPPPPPYQQPSASSSSSSSGSGAKQTVKREAAASNPLATIFSGADYDEDGNYCSSSSIEGADADVDANHSDNSITVHSPFASNSTLAKEFLKSCKIKPVDPQSIPLTIEGLRTLATQRAWSTVRSTSHMLMDELPSLKDVFIEGKGLSAVLKIRFHSLFVLTMFDELVTEATRLIQYFDEDLSQVRAKTATTCSISMSLKILLAEVKFVTGRPDEAIEQLSHLSESIAAYTESGSHLSGTTFKAYFERWNWQIRSSIVNMLCKQRQWAAAIRLLRELYRELDGRIKQHPSEDLHRSRILLLCRLSRLVIHMGDVDTGAFYAEKAREALDTAPTAVQESDCRDYVAHSQAVILFVQNKFDEALTDFDEVIERAMARKEQEALSNTYDSSSLPLLDGVEGELIEDSLLSLAINNYAVCAVYVKQISIAMQRLEAIIQSDPVRHFCDPIVFNLCTIYDLSFSPEISTNKKKMLQKVASTYHVLEALNWRSFRLS